ncbi:MAG: class I SAM-dependent methyltransferase [Rhodobacteraceae bacterium]|nr:class I SAM-dependent methyltransferase [Paracoccaceae bacterium]
MDIERKPTTAKVNGQLWGSRARDWAEIQEQSVRPVYVELLKRTKVGNGTSYLDVGCGSGMAASLAADLGANVSGIDASEELLAIANERVPKANFQHGDMESLPFEDNSFDVVTGFNSFQYAGNPQIALAEARRVTKPSGHVVIMTWGTPEGMEAASLVAALKPVLPAPPPGAPGPFALSDETVLRDFASAAGLKPISVFDVQSPWSYADEAAAIRGLGSSGVAARAMAHSGESAVDAAHAAAIAPFRKPDGSYCINANFRCLLSQP